MTQLFSYYRSSCSWRVRVALHWKQVPFDLFPVHLVNDGGEQLHASFRQRNPMCQVPVLTDGELNIGQSVAILEYLEEQYPERPLLPQGIHERAHVRQLVEIINSGTQPLQNLSVLKHLSGHLNLDSQSTREWARHWIANGLRAFQQCCQPRCGTYSVGNAVTLADLCLIPQLYNARRFDVDLGEFETLLRIEENLEQLPSFQAAHPAQQRDAA